MRIYGLLDSVFKVLRLRAKYFSRATDLYADYRLDKDDINSCSVDIGSGPNPKNPFNAGQIFGLDVQDYDNEKIYQCDFNVEKLPFRDSSIDFITAFDVVEHVPRVIIYDNVTVNPFVELMNEIHRVLKPGGIFFSKTPAFPFEEAFVDPTHVNFITENTFRDYFCNDNWAEIYGFKGSFNLLDEGWQNKKYFVFLEKV